MSKSGSKLPPTTKPRPSSIKPAIAKPPKVKPAKPESVTEPQHPANRLAGGKASAVPTPGVSADSDCNPSEPVPALLQVTVGKNLRAARIAAGLTLRQVADMSGILFQYVSKIENGEKNLTLSTIDNLAKVLRVNVSDLMRKSPP